MELLLIILGGALTAAIVYVLTQAMRTGTRRDDAKTPSDDGDETP